MTGLPTVEAIDRALPQTQCTRCGYADCAAYATAIAKDAAPVDRCPPGGDATLTALVRITGRVADRVDPRCGAFDALEVAVVDETRCVGCTICIQACPVDAIAGAPRRLHAVIDILCSGCGLCVAPCPVDCISMTPADRRWTADDADEARERHRARRSRLAGGRRVSERRVERADGTAPAIAVDPAARRRVAVAAAIERARARRAAAALRSEP
ncbi:MAG: RnfABCDGE type electron transport complex subunit B [Burkholderiales bacterium]